MTDAYGTDSRFLHRNDSPNTSVVAAYAVDTTVLERKVHDAIIGSGNVGLIADDILQMYPQLPYSSVTARFAGLINKKHIFRRKGDTRKGRSGRQQMVMRDITYSEDNKMTIAPWSFSKIKAFEQCPKQFYHEKILKQYPVRESEAMLYGTHFHSAAEEYVKSGTPMPKRFDYAVKALDSLQAKQGKKLCEYKLGLTKDLEPCGFFDEDVWFRGIADLIILDNDIAWVVDYKTGKSARYADKGQLELMALATFKHFPEVTEVRAGLLFVVSKDLVKDTYKKKEEERILWHKWLTNYEKMEAAAENNVWNPRPSGLCKRHCAVTECAHNGRN